MYKGPAGSEIPRGKWDRAGGGDDRPFLTKKSTLREFRRRYFDFILNKIKNWLLNKIEAGQLSRGDVIPSEARFSEARRVSRATVRQAFYELRLEGYVVREKDVARSLDYLILITSAFDSGNHAGKK